jgi:hypothetical protein
MSDFSFHWTSMPLSCGYLMGAKIDTGLKTLSHQRMNRFIKPFLALDWGWGSLNEPLQQPTNNAQASSGSLIKEAGLIHCYVYHRRSLCRCSRREPLGPPCLFAYLTSWWFHSQASPPSSNVNPGPSNLARRPVFLRISARMMPVELGVENNQCYGGASSGESSLR